MQLTSLLTHAYLKLYLAQSYLASDVLTDFCADGMRQIIGQISGSICVKEAAKCSPVLGCGRLMLRDWKVSSSRTEDSAPPTW